MIEAAHSSVANASVVRQSTEQMSSARVVEAPVSSEVKDSVAKMPQAPYISPYISVDVHYNKAVLQIRDSDTGDVVQQFPNESRLAQIRREQTALESKRLNSSAGTQTQQPVASSPNRASSPSGSVSAPSSGVSANVITVQEATSVPSVNSTVSPSVAALSAGAYSSAGASSSVTVFA